MKLIDAEIGKIYKVKEINLEYVVKRRLEILGMTENVNISILNKKRHGAVIIKVRGTRFALGKKFAEGIELGGASEWKTILT